MRPVLSRRERRAFRDLPALLHAGAPAFVPMLDITLGLLLDRRRNPFWRDAEGCEWVAWEGGRPRGRIGACVDPALLARVPGCAAVGLFDAPEAPEVAEALFGTALGWLRDRGARRVRGPLNYSIHDTAGVLTEGFDTPPTIDTTWNPPYYDALWRAAGFEPAQEMIAAAGRLAIDGPERTHRFADLARQRGVTVRPLDLKRFAEEVARLCDVYNRAWDGNWGHVPIPPEIFAFKAKDLRAVLDPDLVRLAELDGEIVGFLLGLPDLNVAIRRCHGRLLPFGWWHLLRARKAGGRTRVVALGVVPGHRIRGVDALLLSDCARAIHDRYAWAEASWVLAENRAMVNGLALYGLRPYKRWRMYERDLDAGRTTPIAPAAT